MSGGDLSYEVVDVFTTTPYEGNPLAVVLDADGLSDVDMQAIAREFHLSETTFVLPPSSGADYRVRIFTPYTELPFAGHPSVGTAWALAAAGRIPTGAVVQECGAGLLPVSVSSSGATLTGGAATVGPPVDPLPLLAAVGLEEADFAGPPPRVAGCGISFGYLSVRPGAVERAVPDSRALLPLGLDSGVSVSTWDSAARVAHTRVFAPGAGVEEDPATGSAALGYGVWLAASGLVGDGDTSYTVRQGVEMLRPSTLECVVTVAEGAVVRATVTGSVVPVARGTLRRP